MKRPKGALRFKKETDEVFKISWQRIKKIKRHGALLLPLNIRSIKKQSKTLGIELP